MNRPPRASLSRRALLGGLATLPTSVTMAEETPTTSQLFSRAPARPTTAGQVLNVMEFEALARDALPPAHFGYIATGADDDRTVPYIQGGD
jgi:(S)-2-hydroxy-acid oxidase